MSKAKLWRAVGLMSGTSADGIDAAIIETDGESVVQCVAATSMPYQPEFKDRIVAAYGRWDKDAGIAALETDMTRLHAELVGQILVSSGFSANSVDVLGFHGQTISHDATNGRTWQIGDGPLLAALTGIDVVYDFRQADMAAGGEGAPLAPALHQALAADLPKPLAVVNIGGVANITFLPEAGSPLAFDTGPGNGLIDDWVNARAGLQCDRDGALAAAGAADSERLQTWLTNPYFDRSPPKSLDRKDFDGLDLEGLGLEDGAATLTAFTARTIARAAEHLPSMPSQWLVTGGGRHNPTLMAELRDVLPGMVGPVEAVGWDGDAIEAQAFAYLAVRSRRSLPLTWPTTTGAARPTPGGRFAPAARDGAARDPAQEAQAISARRSSR